uniref:SPRY domain-containing SOCS box protein 3 n=1 Tax=Astyanax mexicanus TaxID=7994 RepID=A0A8B9HB03_ASTMX
MSEGSPSGRSLWNGNGEMEATPPVMTLEFEENGLQVAQSDSEQYQPVTECVPAEEMPLVVPVTGESFCQCPTQTDLSSHTLPDTHTHECTCGEDESGCVWAWDEECISPAVFLSCSNRKVSFHPDYSCGTAAIRGSAELRHGQHFWEIKMTSPVYGTDMMVGIGTAEVNLDQYRHSFSNLLGVDAHSWGLSYTGLLHHKGTKVNFSRRFGQGSIIGLHLDTWNGTLTFYKNRRWIGVAATGLRNKSFYPMVCSTAAKSSMKVIRSVSAPTSLQYLCCTHLRRYLPDAPDVLSALPLPPGLKLQLSQQLAWVLQLRRPDPPTHTCTHTPDHQPQPGHAPAHNTDYDLFLDTASYLNEADAAYPPDPASFTPTDANITHHLDSASYVDDADAASPDPASFTPADTHITCYPDSTSYLSDTESEYPDSAYCTPAHALLSSDSDSTPCTPVHTLHTHLSSDPDSTPCTPAHLHLTFHPDSASCKDVSLCDDPDSFFELSECSDSASCPCCDAPLPLATCDHDDCLSSVSCCSGHASRPSSPLPNHSFCSASPLPDHTHSRPNSTSGSDSESCNSETCQRKRCRWT